MSLIKITYLIYVTKSEKEVLLEKKFEQTFIYKQLLCGHLKNESTKFGLQKGQSLCSYIST